MTVHYNACYIICLKHLRACRNLEDLNRIWDFTFEQIVRAKMAGCPLAEEMEQHLFDYYLERSLNMGGG